MVMMVFLSLQLPAPRLLGDKLEEMAAETAVSHHSHKIEK